MMDKRKDITSILKDQIEWSRRTFGEGPRTLGIIKHIQKEIQEVMADLKDPIEWIDIAILALDGAWRCGPYDAKTVAKVLVEKMEKNRTRVYPMPTSQDEPSEHLRSSDQGGETLRDAMGRNP